MVHGGVYQSGHAMVDQDDSGPGLGSWPRLRTRSRTQAQNQDSELRSRTQVSDSRIPGSDGQIPDSRVPDFGVRDLSFDGSFH